jgi:prepilin-type N-terminal cleavage/methylation domain-containing protein
MRVPLRTNRGFTLTELMITILIFIIFVAIAVPSFGGMRQRAALRGVGEDVLGFWNQVRMEAVKRNTAIKVGVVGSGSSFCLGASSQNAFNSTPCDCTAVDTTGCNVARWPQNTNELQNVSLGTGSTLGPTGTIVTVLNPRRGAALNTASDAGVITLVSPPGPNSYSLNLSVDRFGRAALCESSASTDHLSDYIGRTCPP